jgi:nitrous oxidase accessory protein NosD
VVGLGLFAVPEIIDLLRRSHAIWLENQRNQQCKTNRHAGNPDYRSRRRSRGRSS